MSVDMTMFCERELKSEILTMRLTPREKVYINVLAKNRNVSVSRYLLNLVAADFANQLKSRDTAIQFIDVE